MWIIHRCASTNYLVHKSSCGLWSVSSLQDVRQSILVDLSDHWNHQPCRATVKINLLISGWLGVQLWLNYPQDWQLPVNSLASSADKLLQSLGLAVWSIRNGRYGASEMEGYKHSTSPPSKSAQVTNWLTTNNATICQESNFWCLRFSKCLHSIR